MFAYCFFCETQKCKSIARSLEQRGMTRSFSPQIIHRHRVKGKNIDGISDFLPGYVFAFSNEEIREFEPFYGIDGIIRKLGSIDNHYALDGPDYEFAMNLFQKNGVVGQVTVFRIGDEVVLDDPLFISCKGKITKIDYRKQRARVDYQFSGMECYTWVACDMINAAKPQEAGETAV